MTTDVEAVEATATAMTTAVAMVAATTMEAHALTAMDLVATTAMAASAVEVAMAVATIALLVAHHLRPALLTATLELHLLAAATKTVVVTTRPAAKVRCRRK